MKSPLISAADLKARLDEVRLLDARGSSANYHAGHLPGAIHAEADGPLSTARLPGHDPARGGRHPLPPPSTFGAQLDAWGITKKTPVVVYDDQSGANAAARAWWMLRALGHDDVYVLDGGLKAAIALDIPLTTAAPAITPVAAGAWPDAWQGRTVTIDDVATRAHETGWKVLDVRSHERFRGDVEQLDPVAGHIPGAVNLFFGENLTADGRFKSREELRSLYTKLLGGVATDHLIVHCGSGVTACHTLVALELAGLSGSSLYVGSWGEWCRSGRPQAKGD